MGELALRLLAGVQGELPGATLRICGALLRAAVVVVVARAYVQGAAPVSLFVLPEVLACALGVHRAFLYRRLPRLRALGLVDARAHRTNENGQTVEVVTV